jgi:hypothetical protein
MPGFAVGGYRAYFLDDTGHIVKARDLALNDDAEALAAAKQLVNGHAVEIWERDRKVAFFKAMSSAIPRS